MADAPFTSDDYTDLIASEHRGKPRFVATVRASVEPLVQVQAFLRDLPEAFDLDTAVGVQLDAVGAWVGISRNISVPLVAVWFSFDVEGLGFDQGIWKGPYDPDMGIYALDDDTYRALIRLKILVNTWDGKIDSARSAIEDFYRQEGSYPFMLDNQDMTMTVCISGKRPIMIMFAIYAGRYVEFKPASVELNTVVPSVEYTPAFGFDVANEYINGFDIGSWVINAGDALLAADDEFETSLRRFAPAYWTIDLPLTASAALITTGSEGMTLYATLRAKSDLVGLKWQSEDKWSHRGLGYYTSPNYTGCILDFDFSLTGLSGIDTGGHVADIPGLVLTAVDDAGNPYYVRLANYLTSGTALSGHIHLDFSGAPVLGGYTITDATQRVVVPWHRITEMSIGFAPPDYDKTDHGPLASKIDVVFAVTNMRVTGANRNMVQRLLVTGQHPVRMCDGGDDAYPLTPERIVAGLLQLGYTGQYVIYIGASHLHELTWDAGAGSFLVDAAHPVSAPVRAWYQDLFTRLVEAGYDPVISQSYEVFAAMCPDAWQQRDYSGAGARTGWEPPSTLISPCVPAAMGYLRDVALEMCSLLAAAGGAVRYQIGEPWWWDGSYSGGGPCIYDASTEALYASETGQAVPTPKLTSISEPVGIHGAYLDWLAGKLGDSTLWLRDQVKAAHAGATTYILLFTPQILSPSSEIVTRLNLPVTSWSYPAFDVLQLEDYDWIIAADWANHARTLDAGIVTLGYPLGHIQYFGGFNLLPSTASEIWPRITMVINDALQWGIAEVCVWARPQVWRDGWIPVSGRLIGALGPSHDAGPPPVVWIFPTDLQMVGTSWGDVVLSFDPGQDTAGHTYRLEILDVDAVVRAVDLVSPPVAGGRVVLDYPVELSIPDWTFPPTYLKWRVIVDGSSIHTGIADTIPIDNAAVVKVTVAIAGQSNALGHATTLSGAGGRKDLVSAGFMRREIARRLGLRDVEAMPVIIAWGSSAADKLADDDPVSGVNYWYDLDAGAAGPRLTQAISLGAALGVPVNAIVWAQGENDASAMDPSAAPRTSSPSRYHAATVAIFGALRAGLGNPNLPIWLQTLGRGWWGAPPDPPEVGGEHYKAARDIQVAVAQADPAVRIGTWTPGVETISGYVPEVGNPGWIHYASAVYHAAAGELAEAIALGLDRINSRPAWTLLVPPEGMTPSSSYFDIVVTWPAASGAAFVVTNLNVVDGSVISTTNVTASGGIASWTFTQAQQIAEYGFAGGWVNISVYQLDGVVRGPSKGLTFDSGTLDDYPVAPTGLIASIVTAYDARVTWNATAGAVYSVKNINVVDASTVSETTVTATSSTASWTFTGEEQIAEYGYAGGAVDVEIHQIYGGGPGPAASLVFTISDLPGAPSAPTGFAAALLTGYDAQVTWPAPNGAIYKVTNYNVVDASVISEATTAAASGGSASWAFTEAEQIAEYGYAGVNAFIRVRRMYGTVPGPAGEYTFNIGAL